MQKKNLRQSNKKQIILMDWKEIENTIIEYYKEIELCISSTELEYLKYAFSFTEELWGKQFEKIQKIKFIMISEAPLFGEDKNYFYNPNSKFSSFFYFKNIDAFHIPYSKEDYNNKEFVLNNLIDKGFLILDLFPFSLNKDDTQINYNSIKHKQYQRLFHIVAQSYLNKKLHLINKKCSDETVFVYRYKRLKEKLSGVLETELVKLNLIKPEQELETLNNNMSLNTEKLRKIVNSRNYQ